MPEVILSQVESEVDSARRGHLKRKLARVLNSKSSHPISFNPDSGSPVPELIRTYAIRGKQPDTFVTISQRMAAYLFEQQTGAMSGGLLCVLDVASSGHPGLIVMKLEREEGARLELRELNGQRTFDMSVLDNLVLTDGTRLFKTAMFLRTGNGDNDFRSGACDAQLSGSSTEDMAKFWLRFLGCTFTIDPRLATQRFFDASLTFINSCVTDPVAKNDIYEHLQSQFKNDVRMFAPRTFVQEYIPNEFQAAFREHLTNLKIPLTSFQKDLSDINNRLRRRAFHTERGITVTVPSDSTERVQVTQNQILVNDSLLRVDHK